MAFERTLVIAKPDAVGKAVVGKIIHRFESEGLRLVAIKSVRPTPSAVTGFYAEHKGKAFFDGLTTFMTSGPFITMVWEGEGAIAKARAINGATDPAAAEEGSLRKVWGTDQRRNLVHASDSVASASREIEWFFDDFELTPYDPDAWKTAG